jgi:peptide/nickel transport system substrate-binding protein
LRRAPSLPWLVTLAALSALGCKPRPGPVDAGGPVDYSWLDGVLPQETERPRSGGTLVVRADAEPAGLNLLDDAHQGVWATRINRNLVYESLLEVDPVSFKLRPALAENVAVNPDAKTFTFRLKQGRQFADGSPVTAEDVLASIDAVMTPVNRTRVWRQRLANLSRWQRKGPLEVEVSFEWAEAMALRSIATLPIYSRASLQGDFNTLAAPIGSGPYVPTEWVQGERLVLERNPLSATPARLERIVFRFVSDPKKAEALLRQGAFDLMTEVSPQTWRAMEKRSAENAWAQTGYHRFLLLQNNFSYLVWNMRQRVLQPTQTRQAFAHVFPAKKVHEEIDLRLELPTTCPYYSGGYGCVPNLGALNLDAARARSLLQDAGYVDADGDGTVELDGAPLKFTFLAPTEPPRMKQIARLYAEELRKVGAQMDVEVLEPAQLAARDFSVVGRAHATDDSETELWQLLHTGEVDGGMNLGAFSHPQVDYVLDSIRWQPGAARRHEMEQVIHKATREAQPILIISTHPSLDMFKRRVHGLVGAPTWYDLRAVWLVNERPDAGAL